jgi:hypothetical protein
MRDKDIDALRKGIEQQVRDEVAREDIRRSMDRDRAKPMVQQANIAFRRVDQLRAGDQLVEVSAGEYFRAAEIIEDVVFSDDGGGRPYLIHSKSLPDGGTSIRARGGDVLLLIGRG